MNVGNNIPTFIAAQEAAVRASNDEAESGGNASSGGNAKTVQPIQSFAVYWDIASKKYSVYSPAVFDVEGNAINVEVPSLGPATWYLAAYQDGTAEIVDQSRINDEDIVYLKKLFRITGDPNLPVEQYHVGVVNIPGTENPFIPGDDTNIVFTEVTEGEHKGKIKVDVYYV